jgi:hypothetical protein
MQEIPRANGVEARSWWGESIPLASQVVFSLTDLDGPGGDEIIASLRAGHPQLTAGARADILEGMVRIEFSDPPTLQLSVTSTWRV